MDHDHAAPPSDALAAILDALAEQGWCVAPNFLDSAQVEALRDECRVRHEAGGFHVAGVGGGAAKVVSELRGDHIQWLERDDTHPAVQHYLTRLETLRQAVNQTFFLGLHELEAHFAAYPAGAFYKRHLDRFRDDDRRALTVILYLNADWLAEDGGQLRFWPDESKPPLDILPTGGTLVTFLSERFWHEVLPARRQRLAITGWFKRR